MSGRDAMMGTKSGLLSPVDNPFLANDLAKYIPAAKAETWRLSASRMLRDKAVASARVLDAETLEPLLPVVQHPMIVVANGRVVAALLPEKSILQKLGFSVQNGAGAEGAFWRAEPVQDGGRGDAEDGLNACGLPILGQVGLVWDAAGRDMVSFDVAAGVDAVVHVVQVCGGDGAPVSCPLVVDVAAGGKLVLIEHWVGEAGAAAWLNAARVVRVAGGASLVHGMIQDLPPAALLTVSQQVQVADGGHYALELVQRGAAFARIENDMLCGAEVDVHVRALQLTGAAQVHDVTSRITLAARAPQANVRQRNIVRGDGQAVFQGKYHVRRAAQKTDAYMLCENLLLDDKAVVNQKPELEIYADDVKCSHGASTGSLRPEQVFYLQARGLDVDAARRLLVAAYAEAPLEDMHPVLAGLAKPLVDAWLKG